MWPLNRQRKKSEEIVLTEINQRLGVQGFNATWALIVTWRNVLPGDILDLSEVKTIFFSTL